MESATFTKLTQSQKDLIFGTLLGDGNLGNSKPTSQIWRYRAIHKSEHKDYLLHKYDELKNLCGKTIPRESETFDKRTNKTYKRYTFNTLTLPQLKFFADMFYRYDPKLNKMVKEVPLKVQSFLTPAALAYFYMDDGSLKFKGKSNAMRICSEGFSEQGNKRIQRAIFNLYGLETTFSKKRLKNGGQFPYACRIYIPEKSSAAFCELIRPHLVDCMKYKVSEGQKDHL